MRKRCPLLLCSHTVLLRPDAWGFPPHPAVLRASGWCWVSTISLHFDTICLETASDPTGEGPSPAKLPLHTPITSEADPGCLLYS